MRVSGQKIGCHWQRRQVPLAKRFRSQCLQLQPSWHHDSPNSVSLALELNEMMQREQELLLLALLLRTLPSTEPLALEPPSFVV
jgi:hypothetical protein